MTPSTTPPPLPEPLSSSSEACSSGNHGGTSVNATPGSAPDSGHAQHPASQPSLITLPARQGNTRVLFSPPNTGGLTGQSLLPERTTVSADPSSGAQPATTRIDIREADPVQAARCRHTGPLPASGEASTPSAGPILSQRVSLKRVAVSPAAGGETVMGVDGHRALRQGSGPAPATCGLTDLPNEVLLQILSYLDVSELLCTSRTSHRLRDVSLAPILHAYRLQRTRTILPPMLWSPFRPSLAELMRRSIFLTRTTVVSRQLARSLVRIRLARRLAARSVLPPECLPGGCDGSRAVALAPALVAKKRAVERERVKDGLRRWVERVWRGEVRERGDGIRQWEERVGVGRVWRLRRFWESVGGSNPPVRPRDGHHTSL